MGDDREGHAAAVAVAGEDVVALEAVPAVVGALTAARCGGEVDLLDRVLPDVADGQVAGLAVEREAPRVAQAEGEDLRLGAALARVEAQQLAEAAAHVLGVAVRVAASATVARARVEQAVGAELQLAAVVVALAGVRDGQQGAPRGRVGDVGIAGRARELVDLDVPVGVGEVRVEQPARRIVGREGDRQQPALAAGGDARGHVEERRGLHGAVADDPHGAALLDDEQARVVRWRCQVDRRGERPDLGEGDRRPGGRGQGEEDDREREGDAAHPHATRAAGRGASRAVVRRCRGGRAARAPRRAP